MGRKSLTTAIMQKPSHIDEMRAMIEATKKLMTWLACFVLAVAVGGVIYAVNEKNSHLAKEDAILAVASGLLVASVAYLSTYFLFKYFQDREQSFQLETALQPLHSSVASLLDAIRENDRFVLQVANTPWASLIDESSEIDFIVQSWDGWMLQKDVRNHMEKFFQRGGRLNLYVYDYDATYGNLLHKPMAERMGKHQITVVDEILKTIQNVYIALDSAYATEPAGSKANQVTVRLLKRLNWYCAVRFRPSRLILSPYAHCFESVKSAPTLLVKTDSHPAIQRWFESELRLLGSDEASSSLKYDEFIETLNTTKRNG